MKYFYLLLLFSVTSLTTEAQITISDNQSEVKKTPVAPYDSLLNFIKFENPIQYRRLTGQRVFFAPFSKNKKQYKDTRMEFLYQARKGDQPGTYTLASSKPTRIVPETVIGKYFSILNVQASQSFVNPTPFVELEQGKVVNSCILVITLKKEENGDIFIFMMDDDKFSRENPLILVPFFEKQKAMYESKVLAAVDDCMLPSSTGGEKIKVKKGDQWTCKEVSVMDEGGLRSYYWPCYILTDQQGNTVRYLFDHGDGSTSNIRYDFITKENYDARELKKKQEEELATKAQQKKFDDERAANLEKYGPKFGKLVNERNPVIGMTKDMCYSAWGAPDKKGSLTIKGIAQESWLYHHGDNRRTYLYFQNDQLVLKQTL